MAKSTGRISAIGGLVAFVALAFGPTETAKAGCGDYLTLDHGKSGMSVDHDGKQMPPGAAPCRGPNCHRNHTPLQSPTQELRLPAPTFKTATLPPITSSDTPTLVGWSFDEAVRRLPGHAFSILRPPQSF